MRSQARLLASTLALLPSLAFAQAPAAPPQERATPPAAAPDDEAPGAFDLGQLHVGGGAQFAWSSNEVEGERSSRVTLNLEGEVGYLIADNVKVAGLPIFSVEHGDASTVLLGGVVLQLTYYVDLDTWAPFARARGGIAMGRLDLSDDDTNANGAAPLTEKQARGPLVRIDPGGAQSDADVTSFLYGAGVGVALPLGGALVELGLDYLGQSLRLEGDATLSATDHNLLVSLGYLLVF